MKKILLLYFLVTLLALVIIFPSGFQRSRFLGVFSSLLPSRQIRIVFVGDISLGRAVNAKIQQKGVNYPFLKTGYLLRQADLTFANLESPLVSGCPLTVEGMKFCGDPKNAQGLSFAGIDLVSVANNHIFDYGRNGFSETIGILEDNEIEPIGFDYQPIKGIKGIKIAFLAYDAVSRKLDLEKLKSDLEKARTDADLVVVSFHWGAEYISQPTSYQKELAHLVIDNGADLIIGHHPHWIQPEETYQGKYIFYSLGNFVFDQMWSERTRKGLILTVFLEGKNITEVEKQEVLIEDYCQPNLL